MLVKNMDNNTKSVIVFGGDGFCGWATSLFLSKNGFDVTIVDNLSRRKIDDELGAYSLTPIASIDERIDKWEELTGKRIGYHNIDISKDHDKLLELLVDIKPMSVVHFAEQRAAPYSMKTHAHKRYTVRNNLTGTHNILNAIEEAGIDTHIVHLGTTGVYGYSSVGMTIPEGYLEIKVDVDGVEKKLDIMYPSNPGSIYHLTKCQDALFFYYYNKNNNLRITDLHQGIVWGSQTDETNMDEKLINRFDYCGDYGTVLNRFLMQSQVGHPLTVHGTGGQTRAFIHIKDTVKCVLMAIENPPKKGDRVKIFNQVAECMTVVDLAKKISDMTGCKLRYYENPRTEDTKNDLKFTNQGFKALGWDPICLNDGLLTEIMDITSKYKDRCDNTTIICKSLWTKDKQIDETGSDTPVE